MAASTRSSPGIHSPGSRADNDVPLDLLLAANAGTNHRPKHDSAGLGSSSSRAR